MRLIDAERAKEDFNIYFGGVSHAVIAGRILDEQPTIEARPVVRGEWEEYPQDIFAKENHCEKLRCKHCRAFFYHHYGDGKTYCPNCGADMRGEEVDRD